MIIKRSSLLKSFIGWGTADKTQVSYKEKPKMPSATLELIKAGKPYWGGRLSTVDLLVLTSLDQLLLIIKFLFHLCYKTSYLNEEVNCTVPSPSVSFPWMRYLALPSKKEHLPSFKESKSLLGQILQNLFFLIYHSM